MQQRHTNNSVSDESLNKKVKPTHFLNLTQLHKQMCKDTAQLFSSATPQPTRSVLPLCVSISFCCPNRLITARSHPTHADLHISCAQLCVTAVFYLSLPRKSGLDVLIAPHHQTVDCLMMKCPIFEQDSKW